MKTKIIITIAIIFGYMIGGVFAQEGFGIEMEYTNTLQQLNEAHYINDNETINELTGKLSGLGITIAQYRCSEFTHPIKIEICNRNRQRELTFISFE